MKAVRYDEFGGIDVLRVEEVERPVPGDGLFVAGTTAWGAVHAVQPEPGETVVISGAAGGAARSPSSSRAGPGPRSSAWRARAATSGWRAAA